jgi:bifunctional NMN adenylyltransferase/nudix hydrolase
MLIAYKEFVAMTKEFDLLVFIGRFQPFHKEHQRIIKIALEKSKKVLVLVGSSGKARTIRNPFTFEERADMIYGSFSSADGSRIVIAPLYDKTYNDAAWTVQVQDSVNETILDIINNGGFRNSGIKDANIGLIGAAKDHTSFYLKMFPQWGSVPVSVECEVHSTSIRDMYFGRSWESTSVMGAEIFIRTYVPTNVLEFLKDFKESVAHQQLANELAFVNDYKKQWKVAPYPVKHVTVDTVIEQSGHILVVKRRAEPGKGLYALPGGHLNEFETMLDGAIRELREETLIKVPEAVLRGSVVNQKTFDDPYRSTIGRVITQGFHIKLRGDTSLPKVKGADDAEKALWIPISDLREDMFFDDHFHIINYFLGI